MIASLPMYWRPETAQLWTAFWQLVQHHAKAQGLILPDLSLPDDLPNDWHDHWLSPDLCLSMACGLPFRSRLRDKVQYVGTLDFGLRCAPGHYYSRVIMRHGPHHPDSIKGLDGLRLAYNAPDSQSGWAASQSATPFVRRPDFSELVETGSHAASLAAVAEGRADIAYIDAVTWRLLKRSDPNTDRVHVSGRSIVSPGLPLITRAGDDPAPLRQAIKDALLEFAPEDPLAMGGPMSLVVLDPEAYLRLGLPTPPPGE